MHQIELIIQRIEHTLDNREDAESKESLKTCLEDIYRIATGLSYQERPDRDRAWKGLNF